MRRSVSLVLLVLFAAVLLVGSPNPGRAVSDEQGIALPAPETEGELSLEAALAERRSVRSFTGETLTRREISQLLWAAQGITAGWGGRTAPSAGALYPLEIYVVTPEGVFRYAPRGHRMVAVSREDLRGPLWRAGLRQSALREAPAVVVVTGLYERTARKYGERARRYVRLEAGHACQNLLLQAVALDLGAVPIGAFSDSRVREALSLPADQAPLYLVPVGHPRQGGCAAGTAAHRRLRDVLWNGRCFAAGRTLPTPRARSGKRFWRAPMCSMSRRDPLLRLRHMPDYVREAGDLCRGGPSGQ